MFITETKLTLCTKSITWAEVRKQRRRRELNPILRIRSASTSVFCFFLMRLKAKPEGTILRLFPQEKKNLKPAALLPLFFFSLKLQRLQVSPPNPQNIQNAIATTER